MKTVKKKGNAVIVYEFMTEELGLSGVALIVYAVIYSFTVQRGSFYATREYLAKRAGCSVAAVSRALKTLVELGLIRKRSRDHTTSLYTAEAVYFEEEGGCEGCKNDTPIPDKVSRFEEGCRAFCNEERLILMPKEKEKRNNITTTTTTTDTQACERLSIPEKLPRFKRFGPEGLVFMTGEQHSKLCDLLGDDVAEKYLYQLETYLSSNPSGYIKNHYRTILRWAEEDSQA